MMAVESSKGTAMPIDHAFQIDETYEFSAPHFFDFIREETREEMKIAERWFETALSHAPSPFMPRIKMARSVKLDTLCDFSHAENIHKEAGPESVSTTCSSDTRHEVSLEAPAGDARHHANSEDSSKENERTEGNDHQKEEKDVKTPMIQISATANSCKTNESESISAKNSSFVEPTNPSNGNSSAKVAAIVQAAGTEACTPKTQMTNSKGVPRPPTNSKNQTAKKIASAIRNSSALKPKNQTPSAVDRCIKTASVRRCPGSIGAKNTTSVDFTQENQAIKRQKLDGGRSRQILDIKNRIFHHKSKPGLSNNTSLTSSAAKDCRDEKKKSDVSRRKIYVREQAVPFVSMAEMINKFHSRPREMDLSFNRSLSHDGDASSVIQRKPKLTLTRPKEPELETSHRARSVKVKSTAELEEEMLANIPKFKARPVNKKILEAPSFHISQRSTPQRPEFQEFHLKTMERANQHAGPTPSVASSTESSCHNQGKLHKLTAPRTPHLETLLRARPPKIKTSQELELEELEKMPKFKARPLNKKIFESKGDLGVFCNTKRQLTIPHEFHFATDERIPPTTAVVDLFDKLSLHSEPHHEQQHVPRITTPNPFHLHTEERGQEKERKFIEEVVKKQMEEERARIPKANPYPYTTDYPVVPPKPEPKECTKPEAFQLESLVRHEEETQRKMEERVRMEKEEDQMRIFKAQPVQKEDPLPVPEKTRKPLTQVQEFVLHVDDRAVDRAEFDKKIKEKEMIYKRYREEYEEAQKMEEEKALKQMRRTMVPHARPVPTFANPFLPQKSCKQTTKPKSPKLRVLQRKERRHVVGAGQLAAATGAAAAQMR